jgi:hypothetical protein
MASAVDRLPRFGERLSLAGRRFHAWWEGYAFDAEAERAHLLKRASVAERPEAVIPEAIWGAGRSGPGDPAWTLRQARALGLGPKAGVIVFGAERGAALRDLRSGGFARVVGLTHDGAPMRNLNLARYDEPASVSARGGSDGGLSFFELYRDPDPASFARFAGERLRIGAPLAFVDFAIARKGGRLRTCFPDWAPGSPRMAGEYQKAAKDAGIAPAEPIDETRMFLPLIARGWARWKRAYDLACAAPSGVQRTDYVQFLSAYAALWAERHDALKAGQLQVVRILARRVG